MQLVKDFFSKLKAKIGRKEKEFFSELNDDFLPIACLIDKSTCITKDGNLCQVVEFTLEDYRLNSETGLRRKLQDTISKLEDKDTAFWIQTIKKKVNDTNTSKITSINKFFFDRITKEYKKKELLLNNNAIVLCVSIFRKGLELSLRKRILSVIFPIGLEKIHWHRVEKEKAMLDKISSKILEEMSHYSCNLLSEYEVEGVKYSELIDFFGYFANLRQDKFEVKEIAISKMINKSKFYFQNQDIRIKNEDGTRKFVSVFSLKEKPLISIKMLADILSIPCEIIISESVKFIDKKSIIASFKKQLITFKSSNEQDFLQKTGLDFLEDKSTKFFAKSNLSFVFITDTQEDNEIIAGFIDQRFKKYGIIAVREDISSQRVFHGIFPGNFKFIIRDIVHSVKEIGIFTYSYTPSLPNLEFFIADTFIAKFSTLKGNPFILGLLKDDRNITISGQRNTGKTVLSNFISCQFKLKIPGSNIYTIETESKSSTFYNAIGGKHYCVSLDKIENSAFFNPFSLFNSEEDRVEKTEYIKAFFNFLVESSNIVMTSEIINFIAKISTEITSATKDLAFYEIRKFFYDSIIEKEIERWHSIGVNYYLFDNRKDCLDENTDIGIFLDYTIQNNEFILSATLNHIINKIIEKTKKKGNNAVIIIDDPFVLFRNNYFKEKFTLLIEKANKNNISFIFKVEDYMAKLRTINSFNKITKCQTQIHFGFRNIDNEYCEIFNVQKHEKLAIQSLGKLKFNSIFKQKNSVLSFYFNLIPFIQTIKILSDKKDTRDEIIKIIEELQTDDFDKILSVFYGDSVPIKDESSMFNIKAELEAMSKAEEILQ